MSKIEEVLDSLEELSKIEEVLDSLEELSKTKGANMSKIEEVLDSLEELSKIGFMAKPYKSSLEKIQEIADERNIDIATKAGLIEMITLLLDYEDDMHTFLEDTLSMISTDAVTQAHEDIVEEV